MDLSTRTTRPASRRHPLRSRPRRARALRRSAATAFVVAIASVLAIAAASPASAWTRYGSMKIRSRVASTVPAKGALLGAWIQPRTGWTMNDYKAAWSSLDNQLGRRRLDIQHHYYTFYDTFPTWREDYDLGHGLTPLISWNGISSTKIADGQVDNVLRARARGVAALQQPVFIRYGSEMDGYANRDWVQGPAAYVRAWQHIHDVFDQEGATNAVWVWCPNATSFTWTNGPSYYPGGKYVDWICADGYNWAPGQHGASWRSFTQIFQDWYDFGVRKNRPLMIGETAAQEGAPGQKADWIDEMHAAVENHFPAIRALLYFDAQTDYPWWVDSSSSSLDAFRRLAQDPYFNTR
jgi:Glycosyl hydrolase family 26